MISSGKVSVGAPTRMRSFDPVRLADLEYRAWVGYYLRRWPQVLIAAIGLVRVGFGMSWYRTLRGAWLVLRANQLWAANPGNDSSEARDCMRRFYALVTLAHGEPANPARAAELEVTWWRVHREGSVRGGWRRARRGAREPRSPACTATSTTSRRPRSARRRWSAPGPWTCPTSGSRRPPAGQQAASARARGAGPFVRRPARRRAPLTPRGVVPTARARSAPRWPSAARGRARPRRRTRAARARCTAAGPWPRRRCGRRTGRPSP